MSLSSGTRAPSRRRRASSAAGAGCRPEPGNDASWCASNWAAHLYSRFRGIPNSRATWAAGRPDCVRSRTGSSLNSLVNRCRWPIVHLRGHLVPFRGVRQTRASSGCPLLFASPFSDELLARPCGTHGAYGGCTHKGSSITTFIFGVSNKRLVETLKDQRWPSAEILGTRGKHLINGYASNAFHFLVYALVKHAPLTLDIFAKDGMDVPIGIPDPRQVPRRENRNTWRPNRSSQMCGAIVIPDVESAPFEHLSRLHIGSLAGQVISSAVPDFTEAFS